MTSAPHFPFLSECNWIVPQAREAKKSATEGKSHVFSAASVSHSVVTGCLQLSHKKWMWKEQIALVQFLSCLFIYLSLGIRKYMYSGKEFFGQNFTMMATQFDNSSWTTSWSADQASKSRSSLILIHCHCGETAYVHKKESFHVTAWWVSLLTQASASWDFISWLYLPED